MNIQQLLEENNIKYWTSGKNVSKDHINIQCCFCDDESNHLGISLKNHKCNCWKCGPKSLSDILHKLLGIPFTQSKELVESLDKRHLRRQEKDDIHIGSRVLLPDGISKNFPNKYIKYLKDRGFKKPKQLINKYDLYACKFDCERYKFRILIPIIMNNKVVSFTTRDVTDNQDLKYKNATPKESIINPKECIFNYDTLKSGKDAFLAEGPFDVMKLGDGAFCLLGVKLTDERLIKIINKLKNKQIERLFIFRDPDPTGIKSSKYISKVIRSISHIVKKVVTISSNNNKDPGDLTFDEIVYLKEKIKFRY